MDMRMRSVSPRQRITTPPRNNSSRAMSVSPPPPDSIPSLTLDEIIASNRRTAAAARRSHYANNHNAPRRTNTPHLHHTPASPLLPPGPSRPRGTPGHHSNRRWHHPYSRPKTPLQHQESPSVQTAGAKRLHVSNLAPQVTDAVLKKHLSKFGKLLDCSVHYDANGDSKGSALIEFANERGAINAMANLQGSMLYGMPIVLDILVQ